MSGKSFIHWLNSNLGLMLLALVLAFIVWLSAVFSADPNVECSSPSTLPLEVADLTGNLVLVGELPNTATIALFAPRSVCERMAEDTRSVRSSIDLSEYEPGDYDVDVDFTIDPQYHPVRVLSFSPANVSIRIEEFITRTVPLTFLTVGEPALGYKEGGAILSDSRVEISGIRSLVDQVDSAVVTLDISDAVDEINVSRPVVLLDEAGEPVAGLDVQPSAVNVRKIIERPGFFRDVSVRVIYSGTPEDGYRLTSITPTPQIITVYSNDPELIRELPGFVETETIDLTSAKANIEVRLRLLLPEGVFVDGESTVLVQVGIAAIESSVTLTLPVELIGLAPELAAQVSPQTVDILLVGPLPVLTTLQPLDVRVVLDLAGYEIGEYTVSPRLEVIPLGITIESILPSAVEVIITLAPTPTPSAALSESATPAPTGTP